VQIIMISAKIVLDTRYKSKSNLYPIVIRVRNGDQLRHVQTGHKLPLTAWSGHEVKKSYPGANSINLDIAAKLADMREKIAEAIRLKITDMDRIVKGTPEVPKMLFSDYILLRANYYQEAKKIKHATKLRHYVLSMQECFSETMPPAYYTDEQRRAFYSTLPVPFELTMDDMRKLFAYMQKRNKPNTIVFKFNKLSQLFNNAIKEKRTNAENVFEQFKPQGQKVKKHKLTVEELAKVEALQLPDGIINDSRNLFLFAYYCKGMRFEDCLRFKKKYIINDRLVFEDIRKGHKEITVKIHRRLQLLIDQYINNNTPYLFPMLKKELALDRGEKQTEATEKERLKKVSSQNVIVNRNLVVVMELAGIKKKIRMHESRHTFAKHMKDQKKAVGVISQALGHGSEAVTQLYLDSLDDEIIDKDVNDIYE
jgi:integrase